MRAEDAQGIPTQSHIPPSILVYEDKSINGALLHSQAKLLRVRNRELESMLSSSSFFTLVTRPRRSLSLKLSDTRVYEPQILTRLGTTAQFCRVVVLKLGAVPFAGESASSAEPRVGEQAFLPQTPTL